MQDKFTGNDFFDEQFNDMAWDQMRKKLDVEMPEDKKRRRGFLWFSFAVMSVAILIWLLPSSNTKNVAANGSELNKEEVVKKNKVSNNSNSTEILKGKSNKKEIENTESTELPNEVRPNNVEANKNKPLAEKVSNEEFKIRNEIFPISDREKNSTLLIKEKTLETRNEYFDQLKTKEKIASSGNVIALLEEISLLPMRFSFLEKKEIQLREISFVDVQKNQKSDDSDPDVEIPKRKIEFGINTGLVVDFSVRQKVGSTTVFNVHFPIKNKFGIRTGVGYSILQKDLDLFSFNSSSVESSIDISSNFPPTLYEPALFSVVASNRFQLKRIHYLDVPLLVTFQPNRKLELQGGFNFSVLIKEKIITDEGRTLFYDGRANVEQRLEYFNSEQIIAPGLTNKQWDENLINGVIGVSWKPTKKLNVNLQYHQKIFALNLFNNNNLDSSNLQLFSTHQGSNGAYDPSIVGAVGTEFNPSQWINGAFEPAYSVAVSPEGNSINKNFYRSLRLTLGYNF